MPYLSLPFDDGHQIALMLVRGAGVGPHLLKKAGWYILIAAEGGTGPNHSEVVFRSRSLDGPYVPFGGNPILAQRSGSLAADVRIRPGTEPSAARRSSCPSDGSMAGRSSSPRNKPEIAPDFEDEDTGNRLFGPEGATDHPGARRGGTRPWD